MQKVEDILPSTLAPLVLPHAVPQPVCVMQTPTFVTVAQSSPHLQSMNRANYARLNPLPSSATCSSSSGENHLYIDSDTSSRSVHVGPLSSSQELLLQSDNTMSHTPHQSSQLPTQGQLTIVVNWAYSGRIRGSRPRSQPLV